MVDAGQLSGLDTQPVTANGSLLSKKIGGLQRAGTPLLNIRLETSRADRFGQITRRLGLHLVRKAIRA